MKKNVDYEKPFAKYSSFWTFAVMPFHTHSKKAVWKLLSTAWKSFVIIQQKQKFGLQKLPVIHVDHEIDSLIPFTPSYVKTYIDFVHFFCRIIRMFAKKMGRRGIDLDVQIVNFIEGLYEKSSSIYRHALSTTNRPFYIKSRQFMIIHLFDPHFLCVPSLHVAIVVGVWALMRQLIEKTDFKSEEKQQILEETFYGSKAITESVLFVKQHSINCVSGALYMLTTAHKEGFFTPQDAEFFVGKLIQDSQIIDFENALKIRKNILKMYQNLIEQNKSQTEWQKPLHDWLDNYSCTNQRK